MGIDQDRRLAQNVKGIEFIMGAGDDRMIIVPRSVGGSLLFQPYKRGEYLGVVDLMIHDLPLGRLENYLDILRIRRRIQKGEGDIGAMESKLKKLESSNLFRATLHPLGSEQKDDPSMARLVEHQLSLEAELP
jgi:2',3'-cyclic-nucleotide 2'-phosphodiesterase (5'-nucleotidase family)